MKKSKVIRSGLMLKAIGLGEAAHLTVDKPYYQGPKSDHFDGERFFNPSGFEPLGFADLVKWKFARTQKRWPAAVSAPILTKPAPHVDDLTITMVGHATLLIQTAGMNVLTDPVWSDRASPVTFAGPKRVIPPGIRFDDLPRIDAILLSHNHYDHMDIATLRDLIGAHRPRIVTPLGNDAILSAAIAGADVSTHDWGDVAELGPLRVHLEPCHHWSARGTGDRRMALWAAFVIEGPSGKILHIGDTGFDGGRPYRDLPARHGALRAAILPIGAYEPRWFMQHQHQNPAEAVQGFLLSGADYAVGHHWGTFQLTDEAREAPTDALGAALLAHSVAPDRFRPLAPGESWAIPHA